MPLESSMIGLRRCSNKSVQLALIVICKETERETGVVLAFLFLCCRFHRVQRFSQHFWMLPLQRLAEPLKHVFARLTRLVNFI